jgi:hypothetical protein
MQASEHAAVASDRSLERGPLRREALEIARSEPVRGLVRAGFVARAITYAVIGGLALALALGIGVAPASPNPQGALALIVSAPLGQVAVAIIAAGLLGYAVWKLGQGIFGHGPEGGGGGRVKDRVANLGNGAMYLVFFFVAIAVLTGSTGNGSAQPKHTASQLFSLPGGEVLVAVAGIGIVLVSLYQVYDAVRGDFANDNKIELMSVDWWRVFMLVGRVGILARAAIFVLVGYFLIRAAIELHAGTAVGIDGALERVQHEPFGSWLLALFAAGLLTFALFSVFEARYRRL